MTNRGLPTNNWDPRYRPTRLLGLWHIYIQTADVFKGPDELNAILQDRTNSSRDDIRSNMDLEQIGPADQRVQNQRDDTFENLIRIGKIIESELKNSPSYRGLEHGPWYWPS